MSVKKQAEKEFNDNQHLVDNISDETIKKRIKTCLNWYIKSAVKAKRFFYTFTIITIVAPILSGILINIPMPDPYAKIISSFFAGLTAVCASSLSLFNFRKSWEIYRAQAEEIKRILANKLCEPASDQEVLKRIEQSMQSTDKRWVEILNQKDEKD